jgi:hypothetical protein
MRPACTLPVDPAPVRHGNPHDRQHSTLPTLTKTQRPPTGSRGGSRGFASYCGSGGLVVMDMRGPEPSRNEQMSEPPGEQMAGRGPPRASPDRPLSPAAAWPVSPSRIPPPATASRPPSSSIPLPVAPVLPESRSTAPSLLISCESAPDPSGSGHLGVRPREGGPACPVSPSLGGSS